MKIKAIFFDIDNTLFPTDDFAELARRNAIDAMIEMGLKAKPEEAYKRLLRVIKKYGSNYPRHFDAFLLKLGLKRDPKIIAAGIAAYHNTKTSILPYPGVPMVIIRLGGMGYKLYIASEGNVIKQWDKLIRLGLHNLFHGVFVTKKNKTKNFFLSLLKKLNLKPNEAVMVGDRSDKDITPAKKAGMQTVRILGGVYSKQKSKVDADYKIKTMNELIKILERIEKDA